MKLSVLDVNAIAKYRWGKTKTPSHIRYLLYLAVICFAVSACFCLIWLYFNNSVNYQVDHTGLLTVGDSGVLLDGKLLTPEPSPVDWGLKAPGLVFAILGLILFIVGMLEEVEYGKKFKDAFVQYYVDNGELPPDHSAEVKS